MTAQLAPIAVQKQPNVFQRAWAGVSRRFSGTAKSSDPLSTWQMLLKSWGVDETFLTAETAQSIPAYDRAIEIVASQIASLPIGVFHNLADGSVVQAPEHPLHDLLSYRPHPLYNTFDFRSALIRQLMTRGNAYVYPQYTPRGRVQRLELICDQRPSIVETDGSYFYIFNDRKPVAAEAILHFKQKTSDGIFGQDPILTFKNTFKRALAEIKLAYVYYEKGGQVGGLLVPDQPMSKQQAAEAMEVWSKKNIGPDKIGQVGMLPYGFKYVRLGGTMDESRLNESRLQTTGDISNITGVHPIMLANLERATFSNVEELNRIFVQFTLRVFVKILEKEMNTKLFSRAERGKYFVRLNLDGLLRGDTKTRADFYLKLFQTQAISPNEIRALENMNAYEGGDEYGKPMASNAKADGQAPKTQTDA